MTYTPGPWTHHKRGSVRTCDGQHDSEDGCRTIAEAEIIGVERGEAEANARLIAAAPDLLAAARLAIEEMRHAVAPRDTFTDAVYALDAAITKAVG